MRSNLFHLPPKAALSVAAALFAATILSPSTGSAKAIDGMTAAPSAKASASTIEVAAISRSEARDARRSIRGDLRDGCRAISERPNRRVCFREAHSEMRNLRGQARGVYRDCRSSGGSRAGCREERRSFWLDQAGGSSGDGGDDSGDAPPRGDD
jgi:hypothetical protein